MPRWPRSLGAVGLVVFVGLSASCSSSGRTASAGPVPEEDNDTDVVGHDPAAWEAASPSTTPPRSKDIPAYFVAARGPEGRMCEHDEFIDALRAAGASVTVFDAQALARDTVATNIKRGDTTIPPPLMEILRMCFATTP